MLKEALDYMLTVGKNAAPSIETAKAEPDYVYFERQKDGSLVRREAAPAPRNSRALSLQPIFRICTTVAEQGEAYAVWYSPEKIVAVLGENGRDKVTLPLGFSEPFTVLDAWKAQSKNLSQPELVRALRTTFADALGQAGDLAASVARLRFNATASGESEVSHGRSSLGKALSAEITGAKSIPETVAFNFPVFKNPCFRALRASVKCAVEVDPATQLFRVTALPGELERAADDALAAVASQLTEQLPEGAHVLYGTP